MTSVRQASSEQRRLLRTRGRGRGELEAVVVCSDGRSCVRGRVTAFCVEEYRQKEAMRQKDCSGGRRVSGGDVVGGCGGRSVGDGKNRNE